MSTFVGGVYAKNLIDRLGIGVTLNAGTGALTLVTGPEICRVAVDPNGNTTANSGSLALQQSDGTSALWINTSVGSGTTWIAVGGSAVTNFLNDVVETFGTTSPLQIQQVYVSASNRFDLRGVAVSQATTQASAAIRVATGADTITGAVVGGASGAVEILSGATTANNAGATAGASGAITISTGASASTLGVSGSTGAILLSTGNSEDANSGSITIQTGTAAGTRGSLIIQAAAVTYSAQAVQHTVFDNNAAAYSMGSTGALDMLVFDTTNGGERLIINAKNGLNMVDNTAIFLGTTPPNSFSLYYATATNTCLLTGASLTSGGAASGTRGLTINTGTRTLSDAVGSPLSGSIGINTGDSVVNFAGGGATGGNSGAIIIASGGTDVTAGANTGGNSGSVLVSSGPAASTAGTSGTSGNTTISTGQSDDGNSGNVILSTGAAGVTKGQVNATARLTTTDGVTSGTARIVGGQAAENPAASVALANVLGVFSTGSYTIPANTLKVNTVIRFEAIVGVTAISGGGCTAQIQVFLNGVAGTLVFDTTALNAGAGVAANSYLVITGRLACRAAGGGGTMVGVMTYTLGAVNAAYGTNSSDIAGSVAGTYTVAVNTTAANTLDISGVTDAAGTTVVLQDYHVYMEA